MTTELLKGIEATEAQKKETEKIVEQGLRVVCVWLFQSISESEDFPWPDHCDEESKLKFREKITKFLADEKEILAETTARFLFGGN